MLDSAMFWDEVIPALNSGFLFTLSLIIPSAILGFIFGVVVGTLRVYGHPIIRRIVDAYVAVFRGVPLLLQLYLLYYALPQLGVDIHGAWLPDGKLSLGYIAFSPYAAAVAGFTLCSAAYHSEYIRGALLSVRQGQVKAAYSLGFSTMEMVLYVVIPQAVRRSLPGCGNEIIYLIKYSSLAHMLTIIEITGAAKEIANTKFYFIEIFLTAGAYYLALTTLTTWFLKWLEKKTYIPGFGLAR